MAWVRHQSFKRKKVGEIMKKVEDGLAFHGDICLLQVDELPKGLKKSDPQNGKHIIGHSETGHFHTVDSANVDFYMFDDFTSYIEVKKPTKVIHQKSYDKHEALQLPVGTWKIIGEVERTPDGWKRVVD